MIQPSVTCHPFGHTARGEFVNRWVLASGSGVTAEILELGGTLHRLEVPDAAGTADSVVLGLPSLADYLGDQPFIGALIGRYANRIRHGRFTVDGTSHQIEPNDRGHALHGGSDGFHRRLWRAVPQVDGDTVSLRLQLHSPDGDMGFPGALDVTALYTLDSRGTLSLDFTATTDRATPVSLTHHAYFNLAGAGSGDVLGHLLSVDADAYLPVDADAIPLGPVRAAAGTAFDFSRAHAIGERIDEPDRQLLEAGGYDHCWVLTAPPAKGALRRAARLSDPASGRRMEVWTTEPAIQVYSGNQLDGSLTDVGGKPIARHSGVCLETQQYPDAPNHPAYPETILRPGHILRSRTEFRFPHLSPADAPAL